MGSRVLLRRDSAVLRRSYLRDAVRTSARTMFDDAAHASTTLLMRGQYDPSLEINYLDDPRLAVGETFTRATLATVTDFEGRILNVRASEARFYGMRRIENLLSASENLTNVAWIKIAGSATSATRYREDGTNAVHGVGWTLANSAGATIGFQCEAARAVGARDIALQVSNGADSGLVIVSLLDGSIVGQFTGGVHIIDSVRVFATGGRWCVQIVVRNCVAGCSATAIMVLAGAVSYQGNNNSELTITKLQAEVLNGQSQLVCGEYVSSGVIPAPFHGANVDGVRYFVTDYNGKVIPRYTATLPAPAVGRCGLLRERASTNQVLQSRDLSTASWTKTTMTAARDQVGADGLANGASSLLSTAANATALQAIVDAAAVARRFSVYMKRLVGVGNVDITLDNGTTWTTVSGSINAASFTRVAIGQTLANPTVGFRIVASGDKVAVDFTQEEALDHDTSAIPTTIAAVTRNKDQVSLATGSWFNAAEGTLAVEALPTYAGGAFSSEAATLSDGTINNAMRLTRTAAANGWNVATGGVAQAAIGTAGTWLTTAPKLNAGAYKLNDFQAAFDGVLGVQDTVGTVPTVTTLTLGDSGAGGAEWDGFIARVHYFWLRVPDHHLTLLPVGSA